MSAQQRGQVDAQLQQLEFVGQQQQPRPLDNPLLYGNYNVAYTSTSRAQGERGQRKLSGLALHVLQPAARKPLTLNQNSRGTQA